MSQQTFKDALQEDGELAVFLSKMAEIERLFCEAMLRGDDFTHRLEVRGNAGHLLHARVLVDNFERPSGVEKKIEQAKKKSK